MDGGRWGLLPATTGVGREPAIDVLQHGDVDLGGGAATEIENDVGDGARVAGWQGLGRDGARLVGVLTAAERLRRLERVGVQPLGKPIGDGAAVVLTVGATDAAGRRIENPGDDS